MSTQKGGVTKPKGFKANGIYCGIKRSPKADLSLIVSDVKATGAAVFTKNSVKAAPLLVSQKHIKNGQIRAFFVNSGNANCFTGRFGLIYANRMAEIAGKLLGAPKDEVIVSSTGIIGKPLPIEKIEHGAPKLVKGLSAKNGTLAAKGILTTDTRHKEIAKSFTLNGKKVTIGACAKGSGMTAPNMATMLAFITTDAAISAGLLKAALKKAVDHSFNCISIDGCMSTNDMVAVMANGLAKNKKIAKPGKEFNTFCNALTDICMFLAKQIVCDAEGGTKLIEIQVTGAKTVAQAKTIGLAVANSNLVKTACFGNNPNWGRVAAAVGSVGIPNVTENNLKMKFSPIKQKHIKIFIDVNMGRHAATIYSADLSYEYVRINVEYN